MNDPFITVVIPVYNEQPVLAKSVREVSSFLNAQCRQPWEIVIANNGSTDGTLEQARCLAKALPCVKVLDLTKNGRGGALKRAWAESRATILSYMDVDLSTDLPAFPSLIEPIIRGRYDLATGSRLLHPSRTTRSFKRDFISRSYNLLVKGLFATHFSDAQCGFKAITTRAASQLLPLVEDNEWFMDTELLVLAEKLGYRILDLPVKWVEDPDTRVRIWRTAWQDMKGLVRLRWRQPWLVQRRMQGTQEPRKEPQGGLAHQTRILQAQARCTSRNKASAGEPQ